MEEQKKPLTQQYEDQAREQLIAWLMSALRGQRDDESLPRNLHDATDTMCIRIAIQTVNSVWKHMNVLALLNEHPEWMDVVPDEIKRDSIGRNSITTIVYFSFREYLTNFLKENSMLLIIEANDRLREARG